MKSPSSTRAAKAPEQRQRQAADDQPVPSARRPPGPADDVDGVRRSRRPRRVAGSAGRGRGQHGHHSAPIRPRRIRTRKTGTPTTAAMIADLDLGRRQHHPADACRRARPARRHPSARDGSTRRVVGADHRPDRRAARSGRRRRPDRPARSRLPASSTTATPSTSRSAPYAAPEPARQVVAEREGVEQPGAGQRQERADDQERQPGRGARRARGRRWCRPARSGRSPSSCGRSAARRTSSC